MLIENKKVKEVHLMGLVHQTLAGVKQGLKTMEIWLVTLPPGSESPADRHYGEVVGMTLKGTGLATVDGDSIDLVPDTTVVIPAQATRQVVNTGGEALVILVIRSLVPPRGKRCWKYWKADGILISIMLNAARRFLNPAQGERHDHCPDPTLIKSPKNSHIQSLSSLLGLKDSCHSAGNLAFPYHRHLKSSSPQMPVQDNETKGGIFPSNTVFGFQFSVFG